MFKITQNVAFEFFDWHLSPFFVKLEMSCLVTLFDCKLQVFKKSPLTIFGLFDKLLSTLRYLQKSSACHTSFYQVFLRTLVLPYNEKAVV